TSRSEITYDFFRQQLGQPKEVVDEHGNVTYEKTDTNIAQVRIQGQLLRGKFVDPPLNPDPKVRDQSGNRPKLNTDVIAYRAPAAVGSEDLDRTMRVQGVDVKAEPPADSSAWMMIFYFLAMFLVFAIIIFFYRRAQSQVIGGGFLGAF